MICFLGVCIPTAAIWPILFLLLRPIVAFLRTTPLGKYLPDEDKKNGHGHAGAAGKSHEAHPSIVDLHSKEEFEQCIEGSAVTAIQFTAGWCGPCKRIGPLYASLAEQYSGEGKVFARIDIDELSEVAVQKGVMSIPAFHVYRKGDLAKKMQGADSKKLEALCLQYFGKAD